MRGDGMNEVTVVYSKRGETPVAEVPLDNAAAFVAGVESAVRAASFHTGVPVWKLLQALTCAAVLVEDGAVCGAKEVLQE